MFESGGGGLTLNHLDNEEGFCCSKDDQRQCDDEGSSSLPSYRVMPRPTWSGHPKVLVVVIVVVIAGRCVAKVFKREDSGGQGDVGLRGRLRNRKALGRVNLNLNGNLDLASGGSSVWMKSWVS